MATILFLANTPVQREQLFMDLYKKAFPAAAKYVRKMGGTFDEAKDIFQDALVVYYEKVITEGKKINTSETAYLLGISRYLWLQKHRDNNRQQPLDDSGMDVSDEKEPSPSTQKLLYYLETAGQKCMEMLKAFYYDKLPVKDIATLFGYSGERSATVQKYKCLEKVRDTVKQKALTYEDFLE
jgi:DNA-directed RNA polymerase specialized sigma24 family protein